MDPQWHQSGLRNLRFLHHGGDARGTKADAGQSARWDLVQMCSLLERASSCRNRPVGGLI